jgi:hypothetical protein
MKAIPTVEHFFQVPSDTSCCIAQNKDDRAWMQLSALAHDCQGSSQGAKRGMHIASRTCYILHPRNHSHTHHVVVLSGRRRNEGRHSLSSTRAVRSTRSRTCTAATAGHTLIYWHTQLVWTGSWRVTYETKP